MGKKCQVPGCECILIGYQNVYQLCMGYKGPIGGGISSENSSKIYPAKCTEMLLVDTYQYIFHLYKFVCHLYGCFQK